MKGFGSSTFGELYADEYDTRQDPGTTNEAVELLHEIAANGKTLELAIGTGRVALPLSQRGLVIQGIEGSEKMAAKLREKPGGENIPVSIGDFADVSVEDSFDFVFLVFNTFFNLTSQAEQVRCFKNVAQHLSSQGIFLIETFVPDVRHFDDGLRTRHVDMDSVLLEATVHDPVAQTVDYQRIQIDGTGVQLRPLPMRYAWPSEIDLMANLAGMQLEDRWGDWGRSPFTASSKMHISVYRKLADSGG